MPTVLITGCDTGLGVEFARQYAEDGFRVLATCLDPDGAAETRAIRGMIEILRLDVSDHAAIEALARKLDREPLDILLSNAGIGRPHPPFGQTDYAHWRRILEVNLIGALKGGFCAIDLTSAAVDKTLDPEPDRPENLLNDGKCDRRGRYWCGSRDGALMKPTGRLFRLDPDLCCRTMDDGFIVSNGIAWSPDDRTMYFADSRAET